MYTQYTFINKTRPKLRRILHLHCIPYLYLTIDMNLHTRKNLYIRKVERERLIVIVQRNETMLSIGSARYIIMLFPGDNAHTSG